MASYDYNLNDFVLQPPTPKKPGTKLDKSRLVFEDPAKIEEDKKKSKDKNTNDNKSLIYYLDDDGEKCNLFIQLPTTECWGFAYNCWPPTVFKEEHNPDEVTGMQYVYDITSKETVDKPTKMEKWVKTTYDTIYQKAWEALQRQHKAKKLPHLTSNGVKLAMMSEDPEEVLKPIYSRPGGDSSKSWRMYIKIKGFGKGRDYVPHAKVYTPKGHKPESAAKYTNTKGNITPANRISHMYFGSHGTTPYTASIQQRLSECNFIPIRRRERERLLTKIDPSEIPEEYDSEDGEDAGFQDPTGKKATATANSDDDDDGFDTSGKGPLDDSDDDDQSQDKDESEEDEEDEPEPPKKLTAAERRKEQLAARRKAAARRKSKK